MAGSITDWVMASGLLALMGFVFKNNKDNDSKVSRLYQRLDETKQSNDIKFTRKDLCELQHKQVNDNFERVKADLSEIKSDIKQILNNGKHN